MSNILVYNNTITHLSKIAKGFKFKHVLFPHFWCSSCFFSFRWICMLEKRKELSVSIVTKTYWYLLRLLNNKPLDHSLFIKLDKYTMKSLYFTIFYFYNKYEKSFETKRFSINFRFDVGHFAGNEKPFIEFPGQFFTWLTEIVCENSLSK